MKISLLRDINSFRELKDEWNALLAKSSNNPLFLRWEWMFYYYKNMCEGQELFLLLVRGDEGELKAIAPFILREERIITRKTFLEFIGQKYSYYLGIISNKDKKHDVYEAIFCYLFENKKKWDMINFIHLSEDEAFKMYLKNHSKGYGYIWREEIQDSCKVIQLQESFVEYISSLNKQFSKRLKYYLRSIKRDFDVELSLPEDEESLLLFWHKFLDLHIKRVENKESKTILSNKKFQDFYYSIAHSLYGENNLHLIALKLDKEIVAMLFGAVWNKTFYFLNIGYKEFSKYSLGFVLPVLCIEQSIKNGLEYFDFLGGGGDYKDKLGGVDRGGLKIQVLKLMPVLENITRKTLMRMKVSQL